MLVHLAGCSDSLLCVVIVDMQLVQADVMVVFIILSSPGVGLFVHYTPYHAWHRMCINPLLLELSFMGCLRSFAWIVSC
jgi:hypothetical protein